MISNTRGWQFILGFLIALGLVSAPLGRYFLPMFQWFFMSSRDVMLVVFICLGFLAVAAMAWHLSPAYSWFILAYLLGAISVGFKGFSLPNAYMVVAGVLLLILLAHGYQDHKDTILFGLMLGVMANVIVAMMQYFISDLGWPAPAGLAYRDPFFAVAAHVYEIEGLASHYSLLSGFLVVAIPIVLIRWRVSGWLLLAPTIVLINHAHHRAGALSLVPLLILLPKKIRYWFLSSTVVFYAITIYLRGAFDTWNTFTGERLQLWTITLAKSFQQPWLGWGPGTFSIWRPTLVHETNKWGLTFLQAHNEFLQVFFEVGLIGIISFIIYGVWLFLKLRKVRPWTYELKCCLASLMALAIISFISFPFRIGMTSVGAIVTLAVFHGELRRAEARK